MTENGVTYFFPELPSLQPQNKANNTLTHDVIMDIKVILLLHITQESKVQLPLRVGVGARQVTCIS